MHPILNTAIKAARRAGNIIMRYQDQIDRIEVTEKSKHDFVSEVDQMAEADIIESIHRSFPDHSILAEESGSQAGEAQGGGRSKDAYTWIIDPLDGTTNFLHGIPHYAVSIGITCNRKLEHAVIFDPQRNDLYCASRGQGARLNDRRIRVSKISSLSHSLLATGFPFRHIDQIDPYLLSLRQMMRETSGVRRAGSAALDLAFVAAGRYEAFWECNLSAWDIAAGALLILEAGGLVSDFSGGDNYLESGNILTGTPAVYEQIQPTLAKLLLSK